MISSVDRAQYGVSCAKDWQVTNRDRVIKLTPKISLKRSTESINAYWAMTYTSYYL